jgi:hypothetical protein
MEVVTTMNEGGFSATAAAPMMNVANTGWILLLYLLVIVIGIAIQ